MIYFDTPATPSQEGSHDWCSNRTTPATHSHHSKIVIKPQRTIPQHHSGIGKSDDVSISGGGDFGGRVGVMGVGVGVTTTKGVNRHDRGWISIENAIIVAAT